MGACSAGRQGRAVGRVRAGRMSTNIPGPVPDPVPDLEQSIPYLKIDHFRFWRRGAVNLFVFFVQMQKIRLSGFNFVRLKLTYANISRKETQFLKHVSFLYIGRSAHFSSFFRDQILDRVSDSSKFLKYSL